jgi:uncharacterized OB-fold protein
MTTSAASFPPLPDPDDLTRFFWDGTREQRLLLLRCQECRYYVHYPRPVCPKCLSMSLAPEQVSGRGTLFSYTVTMQAFHPYFTDRLPYVLAVVALEEQDDLRLTTNIVECPEERLALGLPVEVTFRDVGEGVTLPLFRPAKAVTA